MEELHVRTRITLTASSVSVRGLIRYLERGKHKTDFSKIW